MDGNTLRLYVNNRVLMATAFVFDDIGWIDLVFMGIILIPAFLLFLGRDWFLEVKA